MSRQRTRTTQQHRQQQISQQQIQLMELLRLSNSEIESRMESELSENPALEEEEEELDHREEESTNMLSSYRSAFSTSVVRDSEENSFEHRVPALPSLHEQLSRQLSFLSLSVRAQKIGEQIIGSLDEDGYLRRELIAIVIDLRKSGLDVEIHEIESTLQKIQTFDPPGIAARNLQECLLLQLAQLPKQQIVKDARTVLEKYYELFKKKHFSQIAKRLRLSEEDMKTILRLIMRLNPKPGEASTSSQPTALTQLPDFVLRRLGGCLEVQLQHPPIQRIRISRSYLQLLHRLQDQKRKDPRSQETITFIQKRIDTANWFIEALRQREQTLLGTARIIVERQAHFLQSGDPMCLKPLILKDVAEKVNVDVSTVSRIVNNKRIQTLFGVFSLRYFFTQAVSTSEDNQISNRALKALITQLIDQEDKKRPLSDDALHKILKEKGFSIARRTVAKYREQLHIPVARLRKIW